MDTLNGAFFPKKTPFCLRSGASPPFVHGSAYGVFLQIVPPLGLGSFLFSSSPRGPVIENPHLPSNLGRGRPSFNAASPPFLRSPLATFFFRVGLMSERPRCPSSGRIPPQPDSTNCTSACDIFFNARFPFRQSSSLWYPSVGTG